MRVVLNLRIPWVLASDTPIPRPPLCSVSYYRMPASDTLVHIGAHRQALKHCAYCCASLDILRVTDTSKSSYGREYVKVGTHAIRAFVS